MQPVTMKYQGKCFADEESHGPDQEFQDYQAETANQYVQEYLKQAFSQFSCLCQFEH
jgi:hypothetical protein